MVPAEGYAEFADLGKRSVSQVCRLEDGTSVVDGHLTRAKVFKREVDG